MRPDASLGNRFGGWLNRAFARPERQVIRDDVDEHEGQHQRHDKLNPPIPVGALPKMMARMLMIPGLSSFAFNIVTAAAHFAPINRRAEATYSIASA
jgi:hypothetical protein